MALIGAVEAGGTKFVLALARSDGPIVARERIATGTAAETLPAMADWFEALERTHGRIGAFGIASFGPIGIDPAAPGYGHFTATPKRGWTGAGYPQALGRFGVPLAIDTDVNGAALGEWLRGAGQGCSIFAYTTVGTGIGTGVVRDGHALAGVTHYESGHLPVRHDAERDAFPGLCPFHGDCLEGLASGPAITARWGHDLSNATPDQIGLIASYLSDLAMALVLLHMPEKLIFGGGASKAPGLLAALRQKTRERLAGYVERWSGDLCEQIVSPDLGDDAGITGAVELGRRALPPG